MSASRNFSRPKSSYLLYCIARCLSGAKRCHLGMKEAHRGLFSGEVTNVATPSILILVFFMNVGIVTESHCDL